MTSLRRAWLLSLLAVSAGCTQDFGLFEPSGGSGGSGNQGGGGSGNQGGGGSGNQGGGGTGNQGGGGAGNQGGGGAGNQGGGGATGGGGSGGCSSPAQCPDPGDCQSATCDMGACGTIQDAMGTPCGPNNMQVCDAAGACVDCLTANDCPNPGDACMNGACVASSCMDGMQNGAETDQDCGGPICPKCAVNDGCMAASDCVTNLCVGGTCEECQSEFDCDQADFCDEAANPNVCKPELVDGTPCMNNSDCVSNECTDGYCCDVACQGNCESCDGALTGQANGVCSPVTAGSDPFGGCNDFGCGSGTCDGNGACGFDPPNTPCGNTVCANGTVTTGACQANGMCQAGGLVSDCGGHACNGNGSGCDTDCNGQDNQCVLGFHCVGSNCVADIAQGGACNVTNDCVLGLTCIDGVCCDTPCGALCQACTAAKKGAGADGTCGFVMMGSDPDNECAGNCNGSGACM